MRPQEIETEHEVMECPVCHLTIKAKVTVMPHLGKPEITSTGDGAVTIPVTATMTRFSISHICTGPHEPATDEATA